MNKSDLSGIIGSSQKPNIIIILFTLTEEIDCNIMNSAMQKTIKRYPYYAFRIIKTEKGYDKIENSLPIVVKESFSDEIILGSKDVNYHWVAAAVDGRQLKLFMSHITLLTIYMAKMFKRLFPENKKNIYTGVAADIRKALGCPQSRFTNSYLVFIHHDPAKLDHNLERLGTMTRGQIILQSDEAILRHIHNTVINTRSQLRNATDMEEKQRIMKELYHVVSSNPTYGISYVGTPNWGSLEPYIEEEYTIVMNKKLFIEINAAGGNFCLDWIQAFKNEDYIKTFSQLLNESGINCVVKGPFIHNWPKVYIP